MKVVERVRLALAILGMGLRAVPAGAQERVVESIVPALAYGPQCRSVVEVRNLSGRVVSIEVEGHRASGALAPIAGERGNTFLLAAGERASYRLEIEEETIGAWVKVREHVASAKLSPAVAVSAASECTAGNELRTVTRGVAFPTRNPWFSSEVADLHGSVISMMNTSERAARAAACYSAGGLYSVPERGSQLQPVCSSAFEVQIPPFGSREFPVERDGSSHFSLRTVGEAIVLELLRPVEVNVRVYAVDSSIRFGEEVPPKAEKR